MILYWELDPIVQKTQSGISLPMPECFQYFKLKHWYIKKPIMIQTIVEKKLTLLISLNMQNLYLKRVIILLILMA